MDFKIEELIKHISIPLNEHGLYKNKFEKLIDAKEFIFKTCILYIPKVDKNLWLIHNKEGKNYNFFNKCFELYSLARPEIYRANLFDALDVIEGLENEKL